MTTLQPRAQPGDAESALARYQLLSQYARDIMLFVRPDGRIVEANAAAIAAYGYTREEILGLSVLDLRLPEEREIVLRQLRQAAEGGVQFQTVHRRKDGSGFPVEVISQSGVVGGERLLFSVVRDISDRQRTERALRESEERFRLAADALSGVVYDWDMVTGAVQRSTGIEEITGDAVEDIPPVIGWWAERVHPEDVDRIDQELAGAISAKAAVCGSEYRIRHRDGRYIWVWDRGRLIYDEAGRPTRMIGAMVSVDARRRAEEALRRSEEKFRTVADAAPALFWLADTENRVTWFNRQWLEFTGRDLADEIRVGWMVGIHPDDREAYLQADHAAFLKRAPITQEFRLRRRDGEYRWLLEECVPFYGPAGEFAGYVGACIDISERKLAEEALRDSEDRFRRAADAAAALVYSVDLTAGNAAVVHGMERVIGFRPEGSALDSDWWHARIHPDDLQAHLAALAEHVRCGEYFRAEYRVRHDDGRWVRVQDMGQVIRDADGTAARIVGAVVDVTGRREAEDRLRLALAGARAGAWEWDLVTGKSSWSPELFQLVGLDPDRTPSVELFMELIHPEDRASTLDAIRAAAAGGGRFELEFRVLRPDGSIIWLGSAGQVEHDEQGRPTRARGINQDISERRAAQEHLRLALAAGQAGVWSWDIVTGATTWSPENYALFGFDPGVHHPRHTDWESRIHPDDHTPTLQAVKDVLEGRTQEYRAEYRIVHPERGVRWVTSLGRVDRTVEGSPIRMSGINLDVTQRRETEARLQQAQRVQSVGRLAGGIAHEVNNLMTAVLGFGSFAIREMAPGHPAISEVEQMIKAGERAAAITRQLLAFTRQQVLRPARLELNAVVRELVPVIERLLGAEHTLVLRLESGLGDVQADPGQLEQVLVNLALNSRDAMSAGGTVTIATQAAELDEDALARHPGIELRRGRYIQLSVTDTGSGMDEATRIRVFEPFFTTKPVGQGTGLGLSTVYGIVKQSGGYIWLYSEPRIGTTVKVYLPVTESEAEATRPAAPDVRVSEAHGEVVLVAEDEPMVRSLARRSLEVHGYRVIEAADGRAALELLESLGGGVDLVLSDAVMPELSGRALGEIIGARWPAIPVIYMSGYPGKEVVERGLVSPDAPFVAKPFTPEALARRAREVLDAARSWQGGGPARSR